MGKQGSDRLNILFFSARNSVRSVLAEAMLNRIAPSRFQAFSAGSAPSFCLDPTVLGLLHDLGLPTAPLRSKSWQEFFSPNAPTLDVVVYLDGALPMRAWPRDPLVLEWTITGPACCMPVVRTELLHIYSQLEDRITRLAAQPLRALLASARRRVA